jgi:N6-adenosine-specific RNA methylase IME4
MTEAAAGDALRRAATLTRIPPGLGATVVLADPPWRYQLRSPAGEHKAPQHHYDCMDFPELAAFWTDAGLDFACAPDCALFLWATWPMAAIGRHKDLIDAWGFVPKTGAAWLKTTRNGRLTMGTGYILRSSSEPYFIATRGSPRVVSRSQRGTIVSDLPELDSFAAQRPEEHSRKPDELYDIAEALYPGGVYLELFGRRRRRNWHVFGDYFGGYAPPPIKVRAAVAAE